MFPSLPGAKPCRRGPCGVLLLFVAAGLLASCSKGDPAAGEFQFNRPPFRAAIAFSRCSTV